VREVGLTLPLKGDWMGVTVRFSRNGFGPGAQARTWEPEASSTA
jgi:hypothetical protein